MMLSEYVVLPEQNRYHASRNLLFTPVKFIRFRTSIVSGPFRLHTEIMCRRQTAMSLKAFLLAIEQQETE